MGRGNRMSMDLENKNVIITGANGGIGFCIAKSFLNEGSNVILPIHSKGRNVEDLIDRFGEKRVSVLPLNLQSMNSIDTFVETIDREFGHIDILVNNAGVCRPASLAEMDPETWDEMIDTNLKGPFFLTQKVFPLMKGGGNIVNIASMSGHEPYPGMGVYSASKAGVIMMTRQMALEWAPYGIRVNTVSPGLVRTPLSEDLYQNEEILKKRQELVPLKQIGTGEEIANIVTFLCSSKSSYITGQAIIADGGLLGSIQAHLAGRAHSK